MATTLQKRHAQRIAQYAPLGLWFLDLLTELGIVEDDQGVEITLIWARVGKNVKYLRFCYLIDGHGDPKEIDRPYQLVIRDDQVISFAHEISRIMGDDQSWNSSGMPLFREGIG